MGRFEELLLEAWDAMIMNAYWGTRSSAPDDPAMNGAPTLTEFEKRILLVNGLQAARSLDTA